MHIEMGNLWDLIKLYQRILTKIWEESSGSTSVSHRKKPAREFETQSAFTPYSTGMWAVQALKYLPRIYPPKNWQDRPGILGS